MLNKIAIIGLGTMGTSFVRYALPLCQQVLIYDNQQTQMETLYSRMLDDNNPYDLHSAYVDIEYNKNKIKPCLSLVDLFQNTPDLVIVCTHKETHCEITLGALSAGAHVLVEKPIAVNLTEARKMYEASQKNQKLLFVEFCLHKYPEFEYLAKAVKQSNSRHPIKYQIERIAEIDNPDNLGITAKFDLQSHDVDFCLQTFNTPNSIKKEFNDPRYSKMHWTYDNGLQLELFAAFPQKHFVPFEYKFSCEFSDGTLLKYSSFRNDNDDFYIEELSNSGESKKIILEKSSAYQKVLQEIVATIVSKRFQDIIIHPLLASHALNALELIEDKEPRVFS
jgi:hypothetical protein